MKKVLLHADDFGISAGVNRAILELVAEGLLSGVSVMTERVSKNNIEDIYKLKELRNIGKTTVGLHVELFHADYDKLISRQYKHFVDCFGREPVYIDIHMPTAAYISNGAAAYVQKFAIQKGLSYRNNGVPDFDIPDISKTTKVPFLNSTRLYMKEIIDRINLLEIEGEICLHPGEEDQHSLSSLNKLGYRVRDAERVHELHSLQEEYGFQII